VKGRAAKAIERLTDFLRHKEYEAWLPVSVTEYLGVKDK